MPRAPFFCALLLVALPHTGEGHATPTPVPVGPLHAEGNRLVDASPRVFVLRGVQMSGLNVAQPSPSDRQTVEAMNSFTFRVLRQRWNMNALRLPVSIWLWERDGDNYLRKVSDVVRDANQEGLIVVLAAFEDRRSGAPDPTGLPSSSVLSFWKAAAGFFKGTPLVIFHVFNEPLPDNIPGHIPNQHRPGDWQLWRNGGPLSNGQPAAGMQNLVDAIRSAGAMQIVAVPGFQDALGFQGFGPDFYIRDPNILYEVHPYYDHDATEEDRFANFGFLAGRFPLYAGEWGMPFTDSRPACQAIPRDIAKAINLLFQTMAYFDLRNISWTVAGFEPSRLIVDYADFAPTVLDRLWNCGETLDPQPGIGQFILLWMTGDPGGFGYINADQIASAAGGPASPIAPGEVIAIYGQGLGPEIDASGRIDDTGMLETSVAETTVLFDGVPGPIFFAGLFQIVVQAPYEIAGKQSVTVQAFYRDVPSNKISVQVVESAPEIFRVIGSSEAVAVNENGSTNSQSNPAAQGSVITLAATGTGQTSPPGITGKPAQDPYPQTLLPVSLVVAGQPAEVLSSGAGPGTVGVLWINARIPAIPQLTAVARIPVMLRVGARSSQSAVNIWVK
jgi:uncharacterized protein (TIGR03437 family)